MVEDFKMSASEVEQFGDLEQALTSPNRFQEKILDQYRSHSKAGAYGKPIPLSLLGIQRRVLSYVGGATAGANLVGSTLTAPLSPRRLSAIERNGCQIETWAQQDRKYTIFTHGTLAVAPVAETAEGSESNVTVERLDLSPVLLTTYLDGTPTHDKITDVRSNLSHEVPAAVYNGAEAQMFANLAADTRITSVPLESASYEGFNGAVSTLAGRDFTADEMVWNLNPTDAAKFRVRSRTGAGDLACIENGMLAGVRVVESARVPAGSCVLGVFSNFVVVFWSVEMLVNDVTLRSQGKVRYHIFAHVNSGAINPSAFLKCSDLS